MVGYFLFILICSLLCIISVRVAFYILILGCSFFLLVLPDTGADYGAYKDAYDNAYFTIEYPWFQTASYLTAEPAYKWYTSVFANILPFGFPSFLIFNFLLCILLTFYYSKLMPGGRQTVFIFWLYSLPIIFPTIFYWSPRSSVSLIMIFGGFLYILNDKKVLSVIFFFLGCSIHSQYLLFTFLILYTCLGLKLIKTNLYIRFAICSAIVLILVLRSISEFAQDLALMLDFMPSSDTISAKMHYFQDGENSLVQYRLTSFLSIFIYPTIAWSLIKSKKITGKPVFGNFANEDFYLYVFFCIFLYGCAINIAFIDKSHLASRLGRFSDYIGMCFLLPLYIRYKFGNYMLPVVLFIICMIAPILYRSLYVDFYF